MVDFIYNNGKTRKVNDVEAKILVKAKLGRIKGEYQARTMGPETTEDVEISERTGKPKRKYRRRDMQAES